MATLDVLIIIAYFGVVLGAGVWFMRTAAENLESYFLGSKRINWLFLSMSGAVSNFDITGTMWMVSVLYLLGMKSWWHHWMWGVMLPAFGLAFMAKWVRRSGVMTGAEWMKTRFGDDPAGKTARFSYALMAVITCASFVGYAFQGIGKFATVYIPLELLADYLPFAQSLVTSHKPQTLAVLVLAFTTLYVVLGGLRSVVVTDVIQTIVLTIAGLVIAGIAYAKVSPESIAQSVPDGFSSLMPVWRAPELADKAPVYEMFGFLTIAWVIKGLFLNAGGPGQMYDFQRYLSAKDQRDAAKVAAAWPIFLVVRWAMVAGITLLAFAGIADVTDPEMVMPVVLNDYLPVGLKGLVIAGLLAAFMSTFSSTANSGASYIVRDLWQPLMRRETDSREEIGFSYLATIAIVAAGIAIGFFAESISSIWGWMMMALGGAVIVPNLLRWYWWRINGWGYAAGVLGGILLSLVVLFFPETTPDYILFPIVSVGSLFASVGVSLLTAPTSFEVLSGFYRSVRPFGFWGPVKKGLDEELTEEEKSSESASRSIVNLLVAIAGITGLYIFPMYLVGHWHGKALLWMAVTGASVAVLYFTWYKHLPPPGERD